MYSSLTNLDIRYGKMGVFTVNYRYSRALVATCSAGVQNHYSFTGPANYSRSWTED